MRRTVSVPCALDNDLEVFKRQRVQRAATIAGPRVGQAGVYSRPSTAHPGVANLWVTPGSCGGQEDTFLTALQRLLLTGEGCIVTYDFRSCMPSEAFTRGLAEFFRARLELWADRVKSVAVLLQDNVLEAAVTGPVASFLRACPRPTGCPFVLSHSTGMVEEFFQVCLNPGIAKLGDEAQFWSVVDVLDDPRSPPSFWHPEVKSCLASLAPSHGPKKAGNRAQMLHVLPNGDTRVIQSPPQDVVVKTHPRRRSWKVEEEVQHLLPEWQEADLTTMAALAFDCPREELQQLVGAHFHVGELTVDAEVPDAPWRCGPQADGFEEFSCADGLVLLFSRAMTAWAPCFMSLLKGSTSSKKRAPFAGS